MMRRIVCAALAGIASALLGGGASSAQESEPPAWQYELIGPGIHAASDTEASYRLEVHCRQNAVEVVLYMDPRVLDPVMVGRPMAMFALRFDDSDQVVWVPARLIAEPTNVSIGVGGAAANQIAHGIAVAERKVTTSLLTEAPIPTTAEFNRSVFPTAGAADTIKAAYSNCGIAF